METPHVTSAKGDAGPEKVEPIEKVVETTSQNASFGIEFSEKFASMEVHADPDPFQPLPGVVVYQGERILTIRAVVTGAILGSVIACSNMYLGESRNIL